MVDLRAMQPVCPGNCVTATMTTGLGEVMEWLHVLYCVCHRHFEQRLLHIMFMFTTLLIGRCSPTKYIVRNLFRHLL